jgi:hypothetical protein
MELISINYSLYPETTYFEIIVLDNDLDSFVHIFKNRDPFKCNIHLIYSDKYCKDVWCKIKSMSIDDLEIKMIIEPMHGFLIQKNYSSKTSNV